MFIIAFSLNIQFHSASFVSVITLFPVYFLTGFVVLYCRFYFMYYLLICFCRFYCLLLFLPRSSKLMSLDSPSWMLAFSVIRSWVHRVYFVPHKPMLHRFHLYKEILLTASFIYFPRFTSFSRYFLFHFNSSTHQYLDLRFTIK